MISEFVDRVPTRPNRYKITKSDGTVEYVTIERADEPTTDGTPLNATVLNGVIEEMFRKSNITYNETTNTATITIE